MRSPSPRSCLLRGVVLLGLLVAPAPLLAYTPARPDPPADVSAMLACDTQHRATPRSAHQQRKTARCLLGVVRAHPTSRYAPEALYNAAVLLERAHDIPRSLAVRKKLASEYPRAKVAGHNLYSIAALYEALARYPEAARAYGEYARRYPRTRPARNAAFNATALFFALGDLNMGAAAARHLLARYGRTMPVQQKLALHMQITRRADNAKAALEDREDQALLLRDQHAAFLKKHRVSPTQRAALMLDTASAMVNARLWKQARVALDDARKQLSSPRARLAMRDMSMQRMLRCRVVGMAGRVEAGALAKQLASATPKLVATSLKRAEETASKHEASCPMEARGSLMRIARVVASPTRPLTKGINAAPARATTVAQARAVLKIARTRGIYTPLVFEAIAALESGKKPAMTPVREVVPTGVLPGVRSGGVQAAQPFRKTGAPVLVR